MGETSVKIAHAIASTDGGAHEIKFPRLSGCHAETDPQPESFGFSMRMAAD
jgi:hypothetical protein